LKITRFLVCLCVLILACIPFAVASANSLPPPVYVWFTFGSDSTEMPEIIDAKIIGCPVRDCTEATAKYSSDTDNYYYKLVRMGNLYRWLLSSYSLPVEFFSKIDKSKPYYFRLIVQFSDGKRISNIIDDVPLQYSGQASYRVMIKGDDLLVERSKDIPSWPGLNFNYESFLLSLVSESLVGALFLMIWKKTKIFDTAKFAGVIILVNLISYPVLWSYFLSIAQFHSKASEIGGRTILFSGLIFSLLLMLAINKRGDDRFFLFTLAILAIPISFVICGYSGGLGYGDMTVITDGLPVKVAIFILEVCAVIFETLLLYGLLARKRPLFQMFIISLGMNLASFGIGLLIYNPFA
jgi:hypothetical protein